MKKHDFECDSVADRDATGHFLGYECKYTCKECGTVVPAFISAGWRQYSPKNYYPSKEMENLRLKQDCNLEVVRVVLDT